MADLMYSYKYPHPAVTTDIVIFTVRDQELQLLLIKRGVSPFVGQWALPGGFVRIDEDLDASAIRELEEETGVTSVYLEQLRTFGEVKRDSRERVISVAYFALIPSDKVELRAATDADAVGWFAMDELPTLAFDHSEIVKAAHERLVAKLKYSTIAFQFMPKVFTLTELQSVYELILREKIDKRNFRKSIFVLDVIKETGKKKSEAAHRPAMLYRMKNRNTIILTK